MQSRADQTARQEPMPPLFDISCLSSEGAAIVAVAGELDAACSGRFAAAINDVLAREPEGLVIDLTETSFLDSTALSVLLNARRRTRRLGVELALACDVPSILRLIELTRLTDDLRVRSTREQALASARSLGRSAQ